MVSIVPQRYSRILLRVLQNALLQEASEEWEQCERKMKDVRGWMEKARQTLESPQNKKKPLRDQHAIREKMLSDIAIQKTKITISVEKLEVHFRSGIGGDNRVKETADDLIAELNALHGTVKEQTASLEVCLAQIDQYQQVSDSAGANRAALLVSRATLSLPFARITRDLLPLRRARLSCCHCRRFSSCANTSCRWSSS